LRCAGLRFFGWRFVLPSCPALTILLVADAESENHSFVCAVRAQQAGTAVMLHWRRAWLLFGLLSLLLGSTGACHAGVLVVSPDRERWGLNSVLSGWLDETAAASVQQAAAERFDADWGGRTSLGRALGKAGERAVWLQFSLRSPAERTVLIELAHAHVDRASLYTRRGGHYVLLLESGDQLPFAQRARRYRFPVFEVPAGPEPQEFLLRLQSRGALHFPLTVWEPAAFERRAQAGYAWLGAFFGGLTILILLNLLLFAARRESAHVSYAVFAGAMALFFWFENGFALQFWVGDAPQWAERIAWLLVPLAAAAGAWHARTFLRTARKDRYVDRWLLRAGLLALASAAVLPWLPYAWRAVPAQLAGGAIGLILLVAGWRAQAWQPDRARFYLAGLGALLAGGLFYCLWANFGVGADVGFAYALQLGYLVDAMLLSLGLTFSVRRLRNAYLRLALQFDALVADQTERVRHARTEAQSRIERLHRRSSSRQSRMTALHEEAEHDHATGLPNRQFAERDWSIRIEEADPAVDRYALLHVHVQGLAQANHDHGSVAGDEAVQALASRLARCGAVLADVARLGASDFAVLAGPRCGQDEAVAIGQRLLDSLQEPVDIAGSGHLALHCHVGICLYPQGATRLGWMLARAEEAAVAGMRANRSLQVFDPPPEVTRAG
jgi:diguanylate cyclase (GGDEF)-like protein